MPSSPTDILLEDLATVYDRGYQALAGEELGQLDRLMGQAEALVEGLRGMVPGSASALSRVQESHGRLASALGQAMQSTQTELGKLRRGRQDLRRFIRHPEDVGQRLSGEI